MVAQSVSASTTNVTGYNIVPTSAPTTTTHDSYHSPVNTPVSYQHVTTANQGNRYSFGNCTYYAFDRRQQLDAQLVVIGVTPITGHTQQKCRINSR